MTFRGMICYKFMTNFIRYTFSVHGYLLLLFVVFIYFVYFGMLVEARP